MARKTQGTGFESATSRKAFRPQKNPHRHRLLPGLGLGYYKPEEDGGPVVGCDQHAVKLQDGRVLIAGGFAHYSDPWRGASNTQWNGSPYGHEYPFAEIYDPVSGTFSALPNRTIGPLNWPDSLYHPGTFWSARCVIATTGVRGNNCFRSGQVWFSGGVWGWANNLISGSWNTTKGGKDGNLRPCHWLVHPCLRPSDGSDF